MLLNIGSGDDSKGLTLDIRRRKAVSIVADAHYLPFRDDSFEKVEMIHVLEHLTNPKQALAEARRVSRLVHAKFPTHLDRVPWIVESIILPRPFLLFKVIRDYFDKGPMRHRWIILPFGRHQTNYIRIGVRADGKFSDKRFFRYMPKFSIPLEHECWI